MTAPATLARDDSARVFEDRVEESVAEFVTRLRRIMAAVLALADDPDRAAALARSQLAGVKLPSLADLTALARAGERVGIAHAQQVVDALPAALRDAALVEQIEQTGLRAAQRVADALKAAPHVDARDLATLIGKAANGAQADARWISTRSIALGVDRVALAANVASIWVPERQACLSCLAYAGHTAKANEDFPAGLTFGDKPVSTEPVKRPPLHPNCRCRIEPYKGTEFSSKLDDDSYATALRREAERAVLRGLSDYESQPAALRAAKRLITDGTALPKTVVARASRDIARGQFTDRPRGL